MQYIIGIGSNIGNTILNIRSAINILNTNQYIDIIDKSSLYSSKALLKDNSPTKWNISYLNAAIKIQTSLQPLELLDLLKSVEVQIGRNLNAEVWSPRIIDLDILANQNLSLKSPFLTIPHLELLNRSFALAPLLELEPNWIHPLYPKINLVKHLNTLDKLTKLKQRISGTMRMGICNLSKHSFSDGDYTDTQRFDNFYQLINDGAEIIDIGAESTKPNAKSINCDDEFKQLDNFLEIVRSNLHNLSYRPLISIDTRKTEVIEKTLAKYHDIIWMINDVECNDLENKAKIISKYNKAYVLTHNLGIINRDKYLDKKNAIDEVCNFFLTKTQILIQYGIARDNIYFDLGFGFSKVSDTAQYLLDNVDIIRQKVKLKSLIGHSRKASILNLDKSSSIIELDRATQDLTKKLEKQNINIVRIHKI